MSPIDGSGNYTHVAGSAYGPVDFTWSYQADPPEYPAFIGKDLTPGDFIELYPQGVGEDGTGGSSVRLDQNYPNPFSNSTVIRFHLLADCRVTVKILDIFGKEVSLLVDETRTPGIYEVRPDTQNLPAGIYIYTLSSGSHRETRWMTLTR